jgi:hypothetical protein
MHTSILVPSASIVYIYTNKSIPSEGKDYVCRRNQNADGDEDSQLILATLTNVPLSTLISNMGFTLL